MRKVIYFFTTLLFSTVIFASEGLGIVSDEDFLKVGVTPENIEKAKLKIISIFCSVFLKLCLPFIQVA